MAAGGMSVLVSMTGIRKSFGGVHALRGVDFELRAGEVHGLVGENGAGKTTLMRILAGATQPDAGEIRLAGQFVRFRSPWAAQQAGIALIHQELMLVPTLSVAENIALGHMPAAAGVIDRRQLAERARDVLQRLAMPLPPWVEIRRLSVAQRQIVAIARALSLNARVLIMDEPTAVLSEREVRHLFDVIRQLRAEGVGIVYVSHRLEEVFEIADRVTVLRDGLRVGTAPTAELDRDRLIAMMVGRAWEQERRRETEPSDEPALVVEDLSDGRGVGPCSLVVHRREVVGLAGLVGAGRSELAQLIIGARRRASGRVLLHGRPFNPRLPRHCLDAGLAYVPEDRQAQGLFPMLSLADNLMMPTYRGAMAGPVISLRRLLDRAGELIRRLDIRPPMPRQLVRAFSGGNQQKAVLGRWLNLSPSVFIFDEPTRGIDVAAKAAVHSLIRELADAGAAIVLISSELPELLSLSDRILAMREGRIVADLPREQADEQKILSLILGAKNDRPDAA